MGPSVLEFRRNLVKYREWLKIGRFGWTRSKYNWSLSASGVLEDEIQVRAVTKTKWGQTYKSARIRSSTKVLFGGDGGVGGKWNAEKSKGADVGVTGDTWT